MTQSPWPLFTSVSITALVFSILDLFHLSHSSGLTLLSLLLLMAHLSLWFRDIIRESTFLGSHTSKVVNGLRVGMMLFIVSEVCFFFAFFWGFLNSSLAPTPELGCCWPPTGINPLDPFSIPLVNTILLLMSGMSVTWAHDALMNAKHCHMFGHMCLAIMLGVLFIYFQYNEYILAPFSIADGVYGSTFFVMTGFHGLHVIIGCCFLLVCLLRMKLNHFSISRHFGFEAAAWYWHFVDVVWILLFIIIYCWGS